MDTRAVTSSTLANSVIAVPPLARSESFSIDRNENQRLIRHIEAGGVTTLLYGGNAVLGHVSMGEYAGLLTMLRELAGKNTLVIPSVGPGFGMMMDQANILRDFDFPTAMILPTNDPTTPAGIATGMRRFVERFGRPSVLYLKRDGAVDVDTVQRLENDGLVSWIKYAIVRENPSDDRFLRGLIDAIGPAKIVSGMGEQPAIVHLRDFGLTGFTSGCVCVAPKLSMQMLRALNAKDYTTAEQIRRTFQPLENLRDALSPVRVLHSAVKSAGIADTGPLVPLLSDIGDPDRSKVALAAKELLGKN